MDRRGLCARRIGATSSLVGVALSVFMFCQLPPLLGQARRTHEAKSKDKPLPTLLVVCDLACNWKLDGASEGQINAGGGAKVQVESGQHLVIATTEDGVDQITRECTVKPTGQTLVYLQFQPIRASRLAAEAEAADEAAREAQAEAERQAEERAKQEAQEQAAQEREAKIAAEHQPWTDPATGLMWTKRDNGESISWPQAVNYCRNLRLTGYDDWRLPTIDELVGILAAYMRGDLSPEGADLNDIMMPGPCLSSKICGGAAWSSSQVLGKKARPTGDVWVLEDFTSFDESTSDANSYARGVSPDSTLEGNGATISAWCVRRASNPPAKPATNKTDK